MRVRDSWTAGHLFRRRIGTRPTASVLVAALVLIAAGAAAVVPRLVDQRATAELDYQLSAIGPVSRALTGNGDFREQWPQTPPPDLNQLYGDLESGFGDARLSWPRPLREATGSAQWIVQTPNLPTTIVNGAARLGGLRLTADPHVLSRIRIVEGTAPNTWGATDADSAALVAATPIDIMLSTSSARSLHLRVGDVITSNDIQGLPQPRYLVSGLFEAVDPSAQYWSQNPSIIPATREIPDVGAPYLSAAAYVDPLTVGRLSGIFGAARVSVFYPVHVGVVEGADAAEFRDQLAAVTGVGIRMPGDGSPSMSITTGSEDAVDTTLEREAVLSGLLALLASAPLGVLLAVLTLATQSVVRIRQPDIELAAARGGSGIAVRGSMALEGLVISVPAVIIAIAAAMMAVPGRVSLSGSVLPAIVLVVVPILFAVLPVTRADGSPTARLLRRFRGVAEVAVIALTVLAGLLLVRRGLAQSSAAVGIDPLLAATPLLLAVSVGILVLRGYPLPVRAVRSAATRSRQLAAFVGSIRAERSPTVGLAGVLAVVVGIAIALFSAGMLTTFDAAGHESAVQTVGADARVEAPAISSEQSDAVRAVAGVHGLAQLQRLGPWAVHAEGLSGTVALILAQSDALRTIRPALPTGLEAPGDRMPVVVSEDLATDLGGHHDLDLRGVPIQVVGSMPADSGFGPSSRWMLVDSAFADRLDATFTPDLLLIAAHPQSARLRGDVQTALGPDAAVETVASVAAQRAAEPAADGVRIALTFGAIASVLLCAIALVLSTVAAARARSRTAGILRTLGMPRREVRVLVLWELVPVALIALIAGAVLGVVLPVLVTAAVDLRPFTGGVIRPSVVFDPLTLGIVLALFTAVVVVVIGIAIAVGERLNPSTAVKMGVQ